MVQSFVLPSAIPPLSDVLLTSLVVQRQVCGMLSVRFWAPSPGSYCHFLSAHLCHAAIQVVIDRGERSSKDTKLLQSGCADPILSAVSTHKASTSVALRQYGKEALCARSTCIELPAIILLMVSIGETMKKACGSISGSRACPLMRSPRPWNR